MDEKDTQSSESEKKLGKTQELELVDDKPLNATITDVPPPHEGYLLMKPHKRRRLYKMKKYHAKVEGGILKLILNKNFIRGVLSAEYTVDLGEIVLLEDDIGERFVFQCENISYMVSPTVNDDYKLWKEVICKHRFYRQNISRPTEKDETESESISISLTDESDENTVSNEKNNLKIPIKSKSEANIFDEIDDTTEAEETIAQFIEEARSMNNEMKELRDEIKKLTIYATRFLDNNSLLELSSTEEESSLFASLEDEINEVQEKEKTYEEETKEFDASKNVEEELSTASSPSSVDEFLPKRREKLSNPALPGVELGITTMLSIAAKKIPIPIEFFEPLSMLQVICEELTYADTILNRAASCTDSIERILYVAAFVVSGYSGIANRNRKPFNPILGETYEYDSRDGWKYHSEQISHNPEISAAHADGQGWSWWQTFVTSSKTSWTSTIEMQPELLVRLKIGDEDYSWNKVKLILENVRSLPENRRKMLDGTIQIKSSSGTMANIIFDKSKGSEINGTIKDANKNIKIRLKGFWDKNLERHNGTSSNIFEAKLAAEDSDKYYGFTQFASGLNDLESEDGLPETDSRFRPDMRYLEQNDLKKAAEAKENLESIQRSRNQENYEPLWFERKQDSLTNEWLWVSNGKYWLEKKFYFTGIANMPQIFKE